MTTEELIAQAHANRQSGEYPSPDALLRNLPNLLKGLCDFVLTEESSKLDIARALASVIDAVENVQYKTRH